MNVVVNKRARVFVTLTFFLDTIDAFIYKSSSAQRPESFI